MYQALYRKYRPKDFDSVVGQDSIIKTLKNSIINHNFSHAYMFFGPRGTGKTTISKIFARNINCSNPINGIACHECEYCKVSFSKNCVDIIEIDAASNNGVDEIRDLRNKITLVPNELRYKVYIIDEVHMLSIGAFNALLKTLEEPPAHAIFILATTDPQKVPETIISRCLCFSFKRISDEVIKDRLKFICEQENISIDDEVLLNIGMLSDGGLRDALGLLDKLTSYSSNNISMDDFIEVNGIISQSDINSFLNSIFSADIKDVLIKINEYNNNGKNLIQILVQILNYSRNLLVDYYISDKNIDFSVNKLQLLTNLINEKMNDVKKSGNTKIYIEMLLLSFVNEHIMENENKNVVQNSVSEEIKIEKTNKIVKNIPVEKNISEQNEEKELEIDNLNESIKVEDNKEIIDNDYNEKDSVFDDPQFPKVLNIDEIIDVRVNNTLAEADKNLLRMEMENFEKLRDYSFDQEIGYIICSILDSKLRAVSSNNMIISYELDSNVNQNLLILDKLTEIYNKITNSNKKIAIISDEKWDSVKKEYINNLKNNIKYELCEEPEVIFEELKKNDIIVSSAVELFGDIVEVD